MAVEGKQLLIRTDANTLIGSGHLLRCLALAQAWQAQGGQVTFISACESDALRRRLSNQNFQIIPVARPYPHPSDWKSTARVLSACPEAWVVLDGYHFDPTYQRHLKEAGHPLVVIDDMAHLDHYFAEAIINQNINADRLTYSCEPDTRLLLGTRYVLLRSEFLAWRGYERSIPTAAQKILVTLGGGDPDNQTLKVIRALQQLNLDGLEVVVVVGANNPHLAELRSAIRSPFPMRLIRNATNMPELMVWADVAVSAGGSTCWELAFMGLPHVIFVLAENQRAVAKGLDNFGIALNLGRHEEVSEQKFIQVLKMLIADSGRRKAMSEAGQRVVDGLGTKRVISYLASSVTPDRLASLSVRARPANVQDAELLWKWANDPVVRANSFDPEPIRFSKHIEWYTKKIASPDTRLWILELNHLPVAQIRYDRLTSNVAEIGFSVAPDFRGRGLGSHALIMTSKMACSELRVKYLRGKVISSNRASRRAFTKAGYHCVGHELIYDKPCHIFVQHCAANGVDNE